MRSRVGVSFVFFVGASLLAACSGGSSSSPEPGGNGGGGLDASADATDGATDAPSTDGAADAPRDTKPDVVDAASELVEAGPCSPDEDLDRIPNAIEGQAQSIDTDGDGVPDWRDTESDGDGIPDELEGDTVDVGCNSPIDSDGDGKPDFQDVDSDGNCLLDRAEVYVDGTAYDPARPPDDSNGDGVPDYAARDNDGDGLLDTAELIACVSPDTDGDGLPDVDDPDADGDLILDGQEGTQDFDQDLLANFRDLDSDNDGIPDACEAGPGHQLHDLPLDSDLDGKYDFVDRDSDSDGLLDIQEDKNGNCQIDPGETDPRHADTDLDGASDLVEVALGTDPLDSDDEPLKKGKFYFVLPYQSPAQPTSRTLAVSTKLQRADVAFVVDTNGTMGPQLDTLKTQIGNIITSLGKAVPDLGTAIMGHDDFPVAPYGNLSQGDSPFYLSNSQGKMSLNSTSTINSLSVLFLHNGGDVPESQVAALYRAITNDFLAWPSGNGTGLLSPDSSIAPAHYGALGFRDDALAIFVDISNAPFHNGRRVSSPAALHDTYSFNDTPPYPTPTIDTLVTAMNARGARYIGVAANDGDSATYTPRGGDPYDDMAYLVDHVASNVPPSAFGKNNLTCNTGLGGTPLGGPDGADGKCRLVFDVFKSGVGLNDRVVDGVKALLASLTLDVRVVAVADPPSLTNGFYDSVDTFVDHIEVSLSGGTDVTDPLTDCMVFSAADAVDGWQGPKGLIPIADTYWDTVKAVSPPSKICYDLAVFNNFMVPATSVVQQFHAVIQVKAKNGAQAKEIDFGPARDVLFLVPPIPQ